MPDPVLIITATMAVKHLRLPDSMASDTDLLLKIAQADAIVRDYVSQRRDDDDEWSDEVAAWTDETVPPSVQAAALLQLADLYRHRGDSDGASRDEHSGLAQGVTALLARYRDPAVA